VQYAELVTHVTSTSEFDSNDIYCNHIGLSRVDILKRQAEIIGALELGVLPPGDVDKMLKTLSPEEAHLTKRKFRKIKRKMIKEKRLNPQSVSKGEIRWLVKTKCRSTGLEILNQK